MAMGGGGGGGGGRILFVCLNKVIHLHVNTLFYRQLGIAREH